MADDLFEIVSLGDDTTTSKEAPIQPTSTPVKYLTRGLYQAAKSPFELGEAVGGLGENLPQYLFGTSPEQAQAILTNLGKKFGQPEQELPNLAQERSLPLRFGSTILKNIGATGANVIKNIAQRIFPDEATKDPETATERIFDKVSSSLPFLLLGTPGQAGGSYLKNFIHRS